MTIQKKRTYEYYLINMIDKIGPKQNTHTTKPLTAPLKQLLNLVEKFVLNSTMALNLLIFILKIGDPSHDYSSLVLK